jgi:hypothetical protein
MPPAANSTLSSSPRPDPRSQRLVTYACLTMLLAHEGPYLLDVCFLLLAYITACAAVAHARAILAASPPAPWSLAAAAAMALPAATPAAVSAALLLFWGCVQWSRRRVRAWVRDRLVARDAGAHAARWAALLARGDEVAALQRLSLLASRWRPRPGAPPLRQLVRPDEPELRTVDRADGRAQSAATAAPSESLAAAAAEEYPANAGGTGRRPLLGLVGVLGGAVRQARGWLGRAAAAVAGGGGAPVESLEDLYGLAARAEGLLRAKAQELALAADGCFATAPMGPGMSPAAGGEGNSPGTGRAWEAWSTAAGRAAAGEARVEWGGLKPAGRAAEKLVRCYGGDPSRILDCCRWTEGLGSSNIYVYIILCLYIYIYIYIYICLMYVCNGQGLHPIPRRAGPAALPRGAGRRPRGGGAPRQEPARPGL